MKEKEWEEWEAWKACIPGASHQVMASIITRDIMRPLPLTGGIISMRTSLWPGSTDYTGLNKPLVYFLLTWEPEQQETEELPRSLTFTLRPARD